MTIADMTSQWNVIRFADAMDEWIDLTDEFADELTEFEMNSPIETIYCDNATPLDYRDFDVIVVCFHAEECGI